MSVDTKSKQSGKEIEKVIRQMQESVRNCLAKISDIFIDQVNANLTKIVLQRLEQVIGQLNEAKNKIQSRSPCKETTNQLVTPKKQQNSHSKHLTFGFTSEIKTQQDFQSLASANDQLYKQFEDILEKYRYNKQTLSHQNQIVLNQWIQHTNHIESSTNLDKKPKKSNFFNLVKSLIQELSKYESVEEYINTVEQIEHDKIVNQLRATSMEAGDDGQKKWLKETTREYFLKMAELLKNSDDNTADQEDISDIREEELENMF